MQHATEESPATATLEVVTAPVLHHAMAHNGIRAVHRIVLTAGSDPLADVVVTADLAALDGTSLTHPWRFEAGGLEPGGRVVLDNPPIEPDAAALSSLQEETPATLQVIVTAAGEQVAAARASVRVLAARQWALDPDSPLLSVELLAAFVQPNHPDVGPVAAQAAQWLERDTGSGSLAVEHVTPGRIDAIVEAVAMTIHGTGVYYAPPPASWGYGQKVRSPGDVLGHHLGTCLDTTILVASVLEHLQITPVIFIARGHAFVGWWRSGGQGLPDAASLQVGMAVNAVGLGLMGVLETTMLTQERRVPKDLFRRACQAPRDTYLHAGASDLVAVLDVGMARLMRVYPVPARHDRGDGTVQVVEYVPAASGAPAAPAAASAPRQSHVPRKEPPARVQAWQNSLLDLTLRNRLLNLGAGLTNLPLVMPEGHLGLLANLLQDGRTVTLRAVDDVSGAIQAQGVRDAYGLPGDILRTMLRERSVIYTRADAATHQQLIERLRYRARTGLQETGANPLSITVGRLDWRLGERDLSAPLLLAPVQIKGIVAPWRLAFDETGQVTVNRSLLEKLRLEFGIVVPGMDDPPRRSDGEGVDVEAVLTAIREAISASGQPFSVVTEARVAVVGFTGYLLWRDLHEHWETFLQRPVARHIALTPTARFEPDRPPSAPADLDAVVADLPILCDGSQAEAVAAARAGETFVLEGPPGTGKSQTITNILADQIRLGRRVLFVAEKGAALDVVRRRLDDIGLLPFALDLHDEHARPAQVRALLKTALAQLPRPDDAGYRAASGDVAASAQVLERYAERLHQRNAAGLSLYAARAQQLARGDGPALTVAAAALADASIEADDARAAITRASADLAALGPGVHRAWGFARTVAGGDLGLALERADAAVRIAQERLAGAPEPVRVALASADEPISLDRAAWLLGPGAAPLHHVHEVGTARWAAARDELAERATQLGRQSSAVLRSLDAAVLDVDLTPVRQAVREAASSFFIGRKKRILAAAAPVLAHARPGADIPAGSIVDVVEQVAACQQDLRGLVQSYQALPGAGPLPPDLNLLTDAGAATLQGRIQSLLDQSALLHALPAPTREALEQARSAGWGLLEEAVAAVRGAGRAIAEVVSAVGGDPADVTRWSGDAGVLAAWESSAAARQQDRPSFAGLHRWVAAVTTLEPVRAAYPDARWELLSAAVEPTEAVAAFDRGVARAAVRERLDATGLGSFDGPSHDRVITRFVEGSRALRESLVTVVPAQVIEARPFRPGAIFGTVAALDREINRTRGGLSVRQLIERFGEAIGAITPCVLVSPDSLARFVPPGSINFDLVVFDEASQITVPAAIGALGRARAAVVAGDSRQLPPTSFMQLSAPDEDDDARDFTLVHDEESILSELVHGGVDRRWLSWHYRSQDETLIAFSNRHYYDDRLSSFPSVPGQSADTGLSLVRLDGQFHRSNEGGLLRTNPVEAAAVVAEVVRRWDAGERSIGVVTFNLQQRALVERLLIETGNPALAESLLRGKDGLFVKNLENVQGDERDVILFSTAFAKNAAGQLPLNFGPLNRTGGERRLNVAVTRARRRVIVFSSFDPEDLRVEQTSSLGIKHLRAYLELARDGARSLAQDAIPHDGAAAHAGPMRVSTESVDRHREEIASALRGAGLDVSTGIGLSDFTIDLAVARRGEPPVLAVLLDSPAWAARRTTADRDGLGRIVLTEVMGWPGVHRVWLPDWLAAPERVVAEVLAATTGAATAPRRSDGRLISSAYAAPRDSGEPVADDPIDDAPSDQVLPGPQDAPATAPESPGDARHDAPPEPSAPGLPGQSAYEPFDPQPMGTIRLLESRSAVHRQRVEAILRTIVEAEGPMPMDRLATLAVQCLGMRRASAARIMDLRERLPDDLAVDSGWFVYPRSRHPLQWKGFRTGGVAYKERTVDDISLVELGNAAAAIVASAMGIALEDLVREVLRQFSGTRVTDGVRGRITAAVQDAERRGLVRVAAGMVLPV